MTENMLGDSSVLLTACDALSLLARSAKGAEFIQLNSTLFARAPIPAHQIHAPSVIRCLDEFE